MSHMNKTQLDEFTNTLLQEKKELEAHFEINTNGNETASLGESLEDSIGELSSVDNHPADVATETFERGRDLAVNEKLSTHLDQVNEALQRIEDGTYGKCVECGGLIPYERLQAIPYTPYCVEHTPQQNLSDSRPVEEDIITTPPTGAGEGRQRVDGRFDDADAWESVEEYGNSNTPAMAAKRDVSSYDDGVK